MDSITKEMNFIMKITQEKLNRIASMHISSRIEDSELKKPCTHFRFFRDKIQLFYDFDQSSIILKKNDRGEIIGILIYTYNENEFNKFSGPGNLRFYIMAIKTLLGFYGLRFLKFFAAARSMLGKNNELDVPNIERYGKIWVLLVMEECRRQGIAASLLQECINAMKKRGEKLLRVTVSKNNQPAINAYKKSNFQIIGTCKESSGVSYVMQLKLFDRDD